MTPLGPVQTLICSCCAGEARGRQWSNRDIGYGLCDRCAEHIVAKEDAVEMLSRYGIEGIHYRVGKDVQLAGISARFEFAGG